MWIEGEDEQGTSLLVISDIIDMANTPELGQKKRREEERGNSSGCWGEWNRERGLYMRPVDQGRRINGGVTLLCLSERVRIWYPGLSPHEFGFFGGVCKGKDLRIGGLKSLHGQWTCPWTGPRSERNGLSHYCPISFNSDKILEISTFEKSQKTWKIKKELNPGSEKIGCDAGRPNWMKSDSSR